MAAICAGLALAACGAKVEKAEFARIIEAPADASPAPLVFTGMQIELPTGADIGTLSSGARGCAWPYAPVGRSVIRKAVNDEDLRNIFHDSLENEGYDVIGGKSYFFDEELEDEYLRSEYRVGARVVGVQLDACYQESGSLLWAVFSREGMEGTMRLEIEWSVYDNLRRTLVMRERTSGYARRMSPNEEGLTLLINEAFEMAAHNLGATPEFHDLLFSGVRPARKVGDDDPERPRRFDPAQALVLPAAPLSITPFTQQAERVRKAAVMIQGGVGHASGFFISREGDILTNSHAVGNAVRVRVMTADKEQALPAEVIRVDRARDVALLRLEDKPAGLDIVTLPVRAEWPAISEQVYVIGAPRMRQMQDTVTEGIVSAHRRNFNFLGTKQDFIQADVVTHGGSSGGPMVDRYGNLVGLTVGGVAIGPDDADAALNFFIPIGDALAKLNISVDGAQGR